MQTLHAGLTLLRARQRKEVTQKTVAEAIGVPVQTYCTWENGKRYPNDKNKRKLVTYFQTSFSDLFPEFTNGTCISDVAHTTYPRRDV